MIKKIVLLMFILTVSIFSATGNAILEFVSSSSYAEGAEKFDGKKDIFKEVIYKPKAVVVDTSVEESKARLQSVFTSTMTTIQVGNSWSAVLYYNEPNAGKKRLVISGDTSLEVGGFTYKLSPIANGVTIKDVKTGNLFKLEVKGR